MVTKSVEGAGAGDVQPSPCGVSGHRAVDWVTVEDPPHLPGGEVVHPQEYQICLACQQREQVKR